MDPDHPVTIRTATPRHIPDMIRLERQSTTAAHWSETQYKSLFQPENGVHPRLALIADCDLPGQTPSVVGFLIARHVAAEWELENVVVAAESRGKGAGTRLMQALVAYAQQTNSESVFLEVRESNLAARALYEKLGFHQAGWRKSYYTNPLEDAVLYSKHLRTSPVAL